MLYEYDPISCIGMKVSTKDADTTNRYLNAISQEKDKKTAMQLVRQAEQDEDVPEEKLEKIYNKFRAKFGSMKDSKTAYDAKAKDEDSKKLYVINLWDKDGKFLATRGMFKNDAEAEEHAKRNTKPGGRYKFYRANPNGTKMKDEESYFESIRPKKYKIFGDIVLLKSLTGSTATYTTSNGQTVRIGRRKWDELARKINKEENK